MFTLDSGCDRAYRYSATELARRFYRRKPVTLQFSTSSEKDVKGIEGYIAALAEPRADELADWNIEPPKSGEPHRLIWVRVRSKRDPNVVVEGVIDTVEWRGNLRLHNIHGSKSLRVPRAEPVYS